MEHIKSPLLIQKLDDFLGHPKFDPHGDPIPDENGLFKEKPQVPLSEVEVSGDGIVVARERYQLHVFTTFGSHRNLPWS